MAALSFNIFVLLYFLRCSNYFETGGHITVMQMNRPVNTLSVTLPLQTLKYFNKSYENLFNTWYLNVC